MPVNHDRSGMATQVNVKINITWITLRLGRPQHRRLGPAAAPGHSELAGLMNLRFKASGTGPACRRTTAQHAGLTQSDTVTDTEPQ